jgi:exopolyphosphatase / guanosine-5'-triphosphate,3'-diphosphate pyrophosphatase
VRNVGVRALQQVQQYRLDVALGSSGTIQNLAEIAAHMTHHSERGRDETLTLKQLEQVMSMLRSLPLEERRKVPGISPSRADIIIGGGAIIHTLMQDLQLNELRISERGLREGLLVDFLLRSEHAGLVRSMSVRERSIFQLGRACGFEEAHSRHVARLTQALFDSAAEAGLHSFGAWERELLGYAGMLHDIGTFLNHSNHHAHTHYLISNADLLGFDETEIKVMATLGFFHRKAYPGKEVSEFRDLPKQVKPMVRQLSVFLQLAESLDRRHAAAVQTVRLRPAEEGKIVLEVHANQDCQLEVWGAYNQKKIFKKVFGAKLEVVVAA